MKANIKFSNVYTVVLNQWLQKKKPKSFISDVLHKNVMKEQNKDKGLNRMRFHWSI